MTLQEHISKVASGEHKFENVFQSISRMIFGDPSKIEKVIVNGTPTYDFKIFREGKKHIVGMYEEINSFASFVKDAAEGGSSAEICLLYTSRR